MKKVILSILTGTLIFVSCNGSVAKTADKKVSEHKEIKDSIVKKVTETPKDSIYIDSFFTDIAKTIAGLDNSISKQRKLGLNYSQQVDIQYSIFQKNK